MKLNNHSGFPTAFSGSIYFIIDNGVSFLFGLLRRTLCDSLSIGSRCCISAKAAMPSKEKPSRLFMSYTDDTWKARVLTFKAIKTSDGKQAKNLSRLLKHRWWIILSGLIWNQNCCIDAQWDSGWVFCQIFKLPMWFKSDKILWAQMGWKVR